MSRDDLRRTLQSRGTDPQRYSLDGGLAEDTFCLEYKHKKWRVYYAERGGRHDERWFKTEEEACADLLARMFP